MPIAVDCCRCCGGAMITLGMLPRSDRRAAPVWDDILDCYDELVAVSLADDRRLQAILAHQGRVILIPAR